MTEQNLNTEPQNQQSCQTSVSGCFSPNLMKFFGNVQNILVAECLSGGIGD